MECHPHAPHSQEFDRLFRIEPINNITTHTHSAILDVCVGGHVL